jgi:phosphatidylglycerol:prolipoprotein diacylglycerol transferase
VHPVLFEGPAGWTANAYGTALLLGMLATVPGAWWDARRRGLPATFVLDFYLAALVGSLLGGELLHLVTLADRFWLMPERLATGDALGLVFFGSASGLFAGMAWLGRRWNRSTAELAGLAVTWGMPAHVIGRIGCFLAGCCFGAPTDLPWGVSFPEGSVAWAEPSIPRVDRLTVALHPVQLYEAAGLLVLAGAMVAFRLRRGIETAWGAQTARWAVAYGLLRIATEVFRADPERRVWIELGAPELARALHLPSEHPPGISTSQAIAALLVAWGAAAIVRRRRADRARGE